MNYKIINDEGLLRNFIDWLPNLEDSEQYYVCLFARNKYCKELSHIKSDKSQLKRFTSTKERMFDKIKQLECEVGSYKQYKKGEPSIPIPQEALALYINPNPRNLWKATMNTAKKMLDCISNDNKLVNPQAEAMSEIQKAKGRTCFIDFDIDEKPENIGYTIRDIVNGDIINIDAVKLLRTRGGAHLLVEPEKVAKEYRARFYTGLARYADQTGDNMMPVVGCTQGGFTPHFQEISDLLKSKLTV